MRDPYLDALEQLDQMRDRAFEAEAAIQRVRELLKTGTFEAIIGAQRKSVVGEYDLRRALDGGAE